MAGELVEDDLRDGPALRDSLADSLVLSATSATVAVDETPLFSLRENAIAKEPAASYPERWPCVS